MVLDEHREPHEQGGRRARQLFDGAENEGGRQPRDEQADENVDREQQQDGGQRVDEDRDAGIRLRGEADEVGLPLPLEGAAIVDAVIAEGSAVAHGESFPRRQRFGDLLAGGVVLHRGSVRLRVAQNGAVGGEEGDAHPAQFGGKRLRPRAVEGVVLPLGGVHVHINLQLPVDRLDRLPVEHVRKQDGEQYDAEHGNEQRDEQYSLTQGKNLEILIDLCSANKISCACQNHAFG